MKGWAGVARLGGVGDNLIAAAVLKPLKRMGYMTEVITSEYAQSIYHNNPYLDKLSVKKDGEIPGGDDWQKWFVNRGKEYDRFVHLSHSCEGRHALQKNQTAFWWHQDYRRKLCAGSYLETVCDIAQVPYDFGPLFYPTEDELDRAKRTRDEQIGGKYLTWVISGSRVDKIYPYAAAAICRIIKELDIPVVMVGAGPNQSKMAEVVQTEVKRTNGSHKGLHVALSPEGSDPGGHQHWSIRRSLTQACLSNLVITPDTGIGWATAMEQMPKIAMLSHASADNITKHWVNTTTLHADPINVPCWPCHRLHDTIETCTRAKDAPESAACMADISVETIVRTTGELWKKSAA